MQFNLGGLLQLRLNDLLIKVAWWWEKKLSAMQKTWVQSLGHEDPLEKEMATHSSILAWEIP